MVIMQFQVVRFVDLSEIMCKFLDCPASGMILMIMQSCIEMWQIQKETNFDEYNTRLGADTVTITGRKER